MHKAIRCAGDRLIYHATHHNKTEINDRNITIGKISRDIENCQDEIQAIQNVDPKKLVISFVGEGHSAVEAGKIFPYLQEKFPDYSMGFIFSTVNQDELEVPYQCLPLSLVDHDNWLSNLESSAIDWSRIILDKKFLCLNRRPSRVRERLVANLLKNLKPHAVRASLGSFNETYYGPGIWLNHPIMIDGVVSDQDKCQVFDRRFHSCMFNIVSESSDQSSSEIWSSMFLTEKTWKPFGMRQIPLWMAMPGTVAIVRDLGFDVFDDICDNHSYDSIQDEDARQDRLVELIIALDQKYSILCCRKLRRDMRSRLEHNYRVLIRHKQQQSRHYLDAINSF